MSRDADRVAQFGTVEAPKTEHGSMSAPKAGALVPGVSQNIKARLTHSKVNGGDRYQADYLGVPVEGPFKSDHYRY